MSMFKKSFQFLVCSFALSLLASSNAFAHHGSITNPALYFAEDIVELEGEITDVFWRNPHPRFKLRVTGNSGKAGIWELELSGSPTGYLRQGLGADDIAKVGDHVKVAGYVARGEGKSLGILHLLLTNGQEFVYGRDRPLRWSNVRMTAETLKMDPALVEAAKQAADGVFRVWGGVDFKDIEESDYSPLFTARGRELQAVYDYVADNNELKCMQGMPSTMFDRGGAPMELTNLGDRIRIRLQEYDVERTIYMNARPDAGPQEPSRLGYSVGHWDGADLVVNTAHVDWPYYDEVGVPQSTEATYVERFTVVDGGNRLNYEITITDPVVFTKPLVLSNIRNWEPGRQVEPYNCVATWEG